MLRLVIMSPVYQTSLIFDSFEAYGRVFCRLAPPVGFLVVRLGCGLCGSPFLCGVLVKNALKVKLCRQ